MLPSVSEELWLLNLFWQAARGFSRTANCRPPRWTKPTGSWSVSGHSQEKREEFKDPARGETARPRSKVSGGLKEPSSARSVRSGPTCRFAARCGPGLPARSFLRGEVTVRRRAVQLSGELRAISRALSGPRPRESSVSMAERRLAG